MNKITLIIKREYLTRVRKKSFLIMSIIGPILFGALIIGPAWLATMEDTEERTIAVIDSSKIFIENPLPETDYIKFEYIQGKSVSEMQAEFPESGYYGVLYISHLITHTPSGIRIYSDKQISFSVKSHISNAIEKQLERMKLSAAGVDEDILHSVKTEINLKTIMWTKDGEAKESSTELRAVVGYISGFLIYFFIFLFGAQVMRGVIEEKTNRIIEVIVSSVRPFQLMMGKIVGIAMVGLTQFLIWVLLTAGVVVIGKGILFEKAINQQQTEIVAQDIMGSQVVTENSLTDDSSIQSMINSLFQLDRIDFVIMILMFLFFFLGGYLLYASLFAAIGAAVDNETDTQQFMAPVTIPLILAIVVMMSAINNPDGPIAFWFSIIPFTSPIVMMVRIPFGVPYWEVALSMGLLIATFIGATWMAGKIYRTGILMYGKKVNYKELWKWIKYKI